ncbi:MAG: hypothetical protein ACI8VW_001802 [bacterium]|jgi:hypothetical protein
MSAKNDAKPYGIIVKMPQNDPMSAPHLLGESWAGERWFETEERRDSAYEGMKRYPGNYRKGDRPSIQLTKVDPS